MVHFKCQRWDEISPILDRMLELAPENVPLYLEQACRGDGDLRQEIDAFLGAGASSVDLFARPAIELAAPLLQQTTPAHRISRTAAKGRSVGRFKLVRELDRGGMGVVYEAWDPQLHRRLAMKLLPESIRRDAEAKERFLREARAASALDHPNICTVYDSGEDADGQLYIAMAFYPGENLKQKLVRGPLPISEARDLITQVARGLQKAHAAGIVHRDVKPANVIVTDEGKAGSGRRDRAKILDFGVARIANAPDLTRSGSLPGTPFYMSPEQIRGDAVDARSDIWSLGVTLFELIAGRRPFDGKTREAVLYSVLHHDPEPLGRCREGVPRALEGIVAKSLAKDPGQRYSSIGEFLADLESGTVPPPVPKSSVGLRLKVWNPPPYPPEPYPLLLPYDHSDLLAGRGQDLAEVRQQLARRIPILGLYAPSGAGKSSFLNAGLVPALRSEEAPVAFDRHPHEPGLAERVIGQLLVAPDRSRPRVDGNPRTFVDYLRMVGRLARMPPLLVLDQFESVLATHRGPARVELGVLLAATVAEQLAGEEPLCRWLLAHRRDAHGKLKDWLDDVLREARQDGHEVGDLPFELSSPDRFQAWRLPLLGAPPPGDDRIDAPLRAFRAAIEAPLALKRSDGTPRYSLRFARDDAERLARTFAQARLEQREAPLAPELQVVLAHLEKIAARDAGKGTSGVEITVDEDPNRMIGDALGAHLRAVLRGIFPAGGRSAARRGRSRALLALGELADAQGRADEGISASRLAAAIGEDGGRILERLAAPDARLIVCREDADDASGKRYVLSHARLAEAVARAVEEEGAKLDADGELLRLRKLVALNAELFREGEARQATDLDRQQYRRVGDNADALLWDEKRRMWWQACQRRRRSRQRRRLSWSAACVAILALLGFGTWSWMRRTNTIEDLLTKTSTGQGTMVLEAVTELVEIGVGPRRIGERLRERDHRALAAVFEAGPEGVAEPVWARRRLEATRVLIPFLSQGDPSDLDLVGALAWALDDIAHRDPSLSRAAGALRDEVLEPFDPSPPPAATDPDWVDVPGGKVVMGSPEGVGESYEHPEHEVALPPFRMLAHEVTVGEFRRLFPQHGDAPEDLPVDGVDWYRAYAYAAWRGGRLPTEAEWEYAARANCLFDYCGPDGRQATLDEVGWYGENSGGKVHPVCRKRRNAFGLCDMVGNVWEWVTDWYGRYPAEPAVDPWGPAGGSVRAMRGGSCWNAAGWARSAVRDGSRPTIKDRYLGFRIVLADP